MLKQKTLKESFSLSGKGLHTGLHLTVTFNPAPENHGYKIQRKPLAKKRISFSFIPAEDGDAFRINGSFFRV